LRFQSHIDRKVPIPGPENPWHKLTRLHLRQDEVQKQWT
jgi:hypothetical protein